MFSVRRFASVVGRCHPPSSTSSRPCLLCVNRDGSCQQFSLPAGHSWAPSLERIREREGPSIPWQGKGVLSWFCPALFTWQPAGWHAGDPAACTSVALMGQLHSDPSSKFLHHLEMTVLMDQLCPHPPASTFLLGAAVAVSSAFSKEARVSALLFLVSLPESSKCCLHLPLLYSRPFSPHPTFFVVESVLPANNSLY